MDPRKLATVTLMLALAALGCEKPSMRMGTRAVVETSIPKTPFKGGGGVDVGGVAASKGPDCTVSDKPDIGIEGVPDNTNTSDNANIVAYLGTLCYGYYTQDGIAPFQDTVIYCASCQQPGNVQLRINSELRAHHLKHVFGNGPHGKTMGYVVGYLQDIDGADFTDLEMKSGEYVFWWVGNVNGQASSRFLKVTNGKLRVVWQGDFVYVPRNDQPHDLATAHFGDPHLLSTRSDTTGTKGGPGDASSWINCDGGCCTASKFNIKIANQTRAGGA